MSRQGLILSGAAIMVLGVVVTAGSYSAASSGGGSYFVAYGAIAVGLFRIVRGLMASDDPAPGTRPDPDQMRGRYGPSREGPQLAGSKCVHCGAKILSSMDAMACKQCNKPVHIDCRKDHRAEAHRKEAARPG